MNAVPLSVIFFFFWQFLTYKSFTSKFVYSPMSSVWMCGWTLRFSPTAALCAVLCASCGAELVTNNVTKIPNKSARARLRACMCVGRGDERMTGPPVIYRFIAAGNIFRTMHFLFYSILFYSFLFYTILRSQCCFKKQ